MNNNFRFQAYLIECLTNMHVGSGDNNYGIVDKQVQRDSITNTPVIHSSSLKGALREYFEECLDWKKNKNINLEKVFGSDKGSQNLKQGEVRFFEAKMISIPVRGLSSQPFFRCTSDSLINEYNNSKKIFALPGDELSSAVGSADCETEYGKFGKLANSGVVGDNGINAGIKLHSEILKSLPIVARNSLENGQSENLWYEEIIPRESRFYFVLGIPVDYPDFKSVFDDHIDGKIVQIGANASIGYGFCKITKIS
ncbi:MAG TPA: type III-B CRISPR module RAMP protein Cmr4 [Saprospiraceae bacterium]|nr:type III-B CRISPR module RAMP protein Cmr4 [Saprospiraceae bacterium]